MVGGIALCITGLGRGQIAGLGAIGEEEGEHGPHPVAAQRDPRALCCGEGLPLEAPGCGVQRRVGRLLLEDLEGGQARGDSQRVPGEGPRLVDRSVRCNAIHDLGATAVGAHR